MYHSVLELPRKRNKEDKVSQYLLLVTSPNAVPVTGYYDFDSQSFVSIGTSDVSIVAWKHLQFDIEKVRKDLSSEINV